MDRQQVVRHYKVLYFKLSFIFKILSVLFSNKTSEWKIFSLTVSLKIDFINNSNFDAI